MEINKGERIKLMVTITKRGMGTRMTDYYKRCGLHYDFICLGAGTANSEILDYLGLETNEKDILITMAPVAKIPAVLDGVAAEFRLDSPGNGIVFTVPLAMVSARVQKILCKNLENNEEAAMEEKTRYELILTIINRGNVDVVMKAAKSAGARGGTILHARRVGFEDVENILGFTIQPEKDIVAILADSMARPAIVKEITDAAGIHTESRALVLSLPVDDIRGV